MVLLILLIGWRINYPTAVSLRVLMCYIAVTHLFAATLTTYGQELLLKICRIRLAVDALQVGLKVSQERLTS
jgi:hypothetical protein|tara:strand:- start:512 stop:727 length:216 start_codon:yes stop_codon:yes gene_type:complete